MQARIKNPAMLLPGAMQGLMAVNGAIQKSGISATVIELVHLRVSQINGCAVCVDMGWRGLKGAGETDARLFMVSAWREAPYFSDAERAALALAEAETRTADRGDAVSDEVWNEAAKHFNEKELAALTLSIALTNLWNRMNLTTRQISGDWVQSMVDQVQSQLHAAAD